MQNLHDTYNHDKTVYSVNMDSNAYALILNYIRIEMTHI